MSRGRGRRQRSAPQRFPVERWFPAGVPSLAQRYLMLGGGERVRVVEGGPRSAPTAVFLHGWACSVYTFHQNLSAVAAAGFRVVAFDLRGHGLSEKPTDQAAYSVEGLREHVIAALDAAGLGRVSLLVGHSLGGAIAADVAAHVPDRMDRLALLAPVGFGTTWPVPIGRVLTPPAVTRFLRPLFSRLMVQLTLRFAFGNLRIPASTEIDQYWAPIQFRESPAILRDLVHSYEWGVLPADRLQRVRVPTTVVVGRRDRLIRWKDVGDVVRTMPNATVRFVRGAGHVLPEDAPGEVNDILVALLSASGSNSGSLSDTRSSTAT